MSVAAYLDSSLTKWIDLWGAMTLSSVATLALAFAIAGERVGRLTQSWKYRLLLPFAGLLLGAVNGLFTGGVASTFIAGIYISAGISMTGSVALSLGASIAILIIYFHLGRGEHVFGFRG